MANHYQVNPLVSPEQFQREIDSLKAKYGDGVVERAQAHSSLLNEPKDLTKIEIYIHLINEFGEDAVREANEKVSRYKKGSALRNIATTIKLLRR